MCYTDQYTLIHNYIDYPTKPVYETEERVGINDINMFNHNVVVNMKNIQCSLFNIASFHRVGKILRQWINMTARIPRHWFTFHIWSPTHEIFPDQL